ncbi:MAG: pseudouridine synthase [Solirubrobacterales bacterium]
MRLAKFLAHAGVASRRHAERLVTGGRVRVDGRVVTDPARDVDERRCVEVDGAAVVLERLEYHVVHKPAGVVSTAHDPEGRPKVTDMVDSAARLYPVGRLDVDSTGLVFLTNDGELANRLMHPRYEVPRTYRARVAGTPSKRALQALRAGVDLDDGRAQPAVVSVVSPPSPESVIEITIHEGRNRIVRRMLEAVGHSVRTLERIAFGPLQLGRLRVGDSRKVRPNELRELRREAGLEGGAAASWHNPRP